jgi:two-component system, sensor histidine kinase
MATQAAALREKLRQTALMQAGVTLAGMGLDYLFNVVIFPSANYTPLLTLAICTLVGVPFTWWNVSLRVDAQRARRDLTETQAHRDDALHRLELALDEAEAASRAKSDFLATLSHEIRTPLNGILGMSEAMAAGPLDDAQRERLEIVRQCGQALLAQVSDVLDLAKIEAGKLRLEEIEFDLGLLVDTAAGAFAVLAKAKGLAFRIEIDAARGIYRGDPTRLRQVLYNLFSNALKFTEAGAITVEAEPVGEGVRFCVRDSGVGMTAEVAAGLFEKFAQGEASTARRFGGTGLGLAICRELVEMMGGQISVASAPGEGARFAFDLPLARVATPAARLPISAEHHGADLTALRVLAADDNPINRLVLKTLLGQTGLQLEVVEDGRAAVEAWRNGAFDVILMDVRMPGMDGTEATRAIRRAEAAEGRPRTPIIALTADVMSHQLAEFAAAGMDAHVAKPVEMARLFEAIEMVLAADRDDAAAAQPATIPA